MVVARSPASLYLATGAARLGSGAIDLVLKG
jgi:hypothetical protein